MEIQEELSSRSSVVWIVSHSCAELPSKDSFVIIVSLKTINSKVLRLWRILGDDFTRLIDLLAHESQTPCLCLFLVRVGGKLIFLHLYPGLKSLTCHALIQTKLARRLSLGCWRE